MSDKICCFTGHRDIPCESWYLVKRALYQEVTAAIKDGYTHFLSGFAEGTDLIFAAIVIELKKKYNILLEAAIPYPKRLNTTDINFQRLIKQCDIVKVHSSKYTTGCYHQRNRYMVLCSDLVIAVYDGRKNGGTAFTVRYASQKQKNIHIIKIK